MRTPGHIGRAPPPGDIVAASSPPLRVLCVGCNSDIVRLLRLAGFETVVCDDSPTALRTERQFHPHVCLLDLQSPGMDAPEFGAQLREQAAGRPLVLVAITAARDDASRARITAAGFDLVLAKPFVPGDILDVLDALFWVRSRDRASRCPPAEPSSDGSGAG